MRATLSISLLICFGVCLHEEFCVSNEICSEKHYTVKKADGTFEKCQPCGDCNEGWGLEPKCGSTVVSPVKNTYCKRCRNGTYSSKYDSSPCYECQHCAKHEIVSASCTSESNTNCSGTCNRGYYFNVKDASHACHECSYCCSDGKDEIQPECVRHGLGARHCSPRADKNCGPTIKPSTSSRIGDPGQSHIYILYIILGLLVGIILIIVAVFLWRRRSNGHQHVLSGVQGEDRYHQTPMILHITEPADHGDNDLTTCAQNGNVSHHAGVSSDPAPNPKVSTLSNSAFVHSNHPTPSGTPNMNRPQNGQILKILQHPQSQNWTEGSRVELTCRCEAQVGTEVSYQWYKDDEELQGRTTPTLVLNPVRMRDFGCYKCHMTHLGDAGEGVTTVLDVTPLPERKLKTLQEVKLETRDEVATRLESKPLGTGGWREIACQNDMKEYQIQSLQNMQEPGKKVIEFLLASKPNLTVYSFCKTLKGDKMKRFDIAKVLEGDLVVEKERTP